MLSAANIASHFRIFIDAATLKDVVRPVIPPHRDIDFRIFIDAATLKGDRRQVFAMRCLEFPHLYRCGHIEGATIAATLGFLHQISASL